MKDINCFKCDRYIGEGNIEDNIKQNGVKHKIMKLRLQKVIGTNRDGYRVMERVRFNGTVHKNKSEDPDAWTWECSACQKKG